MSGLTAAQLARRAGTSGPRLSTYASGAVTPSAALLRRLEKVAGSAPSAPGERTPDGTRS
ncbi:helix-turn-helix domain-containing protein [Pseudokineococcus sp. 1T1Z-3]|uniref:helix-turn-helix domain-containing protein n=1 Tax=Pseudokineococcus sp. 1T1Z-3 TaxID=3132745 RepID=UPI00403F8FBB